MEFEDLGQNLDAQMLVHGLDVLAEAAAGLEDDRMNVVEEDDNDDDGEGEFLLLSSLVVAVLIPVVSLAGSLLRTDDSRLSPHDHQVPRLISSPNSELSTTFRRMLQSNHWNLFRDTFRMSKAAFLDIYRLCVRYVPENIKYKIEVIAVGIHYLATAQTVRDQENFFQVGYATIYRLSLIHI